jgi:NADPH:quinone reductase-like Zn-dependent oxidoreductase
MKAIVYEKYGSPDVLELKEVEKPTPKDSEVLVKVQAASVNPYDWHFTRGEPYFMRLIVGLRKPKRNGLGVDYSGQVEVVGKDVTQFQPGNKLFGMCDGAFAEYLCVPEIEAMLKPTNLTFEQAAAVPLAGLTALQGLRDPGQLQSGQRVLIIGASGGVGTFAVQIAKEMGATVTGVCSTRNLEMVRSLGADQVIDYTQEEFTQSGLKYDLIFQLAGMHSPSHCRRALTPKGRLVLSSGDSDGRWIGPVDRIIKAVVLSPFVSQTLASLDTKRSKKDLAYLKDLIEAGKLTSVIDQTHSLNEVPEAIHYVEQGHARGKVVITVAWNKE